MPGPPATDPLADALRGCTEHDALVTLTSWLADRGASAKTVADAVEKPWNWLGDLLLARAATEHENAQGTGPVHTCQPSATVAGRWVCGPEYVDGVEQECAWQFDAPEGYELFA